MDFHLARSLRRRIDRTFDDPRSRIANLAILFGTSANLFARYL